MECTALVLNVNYGHNKELMERCKTLKEYAKFIAIIRRNLAEGIQHQEAVERAVDECIRNNILAKILRKNRGEIGEKRGEKRGKIIGAVRICKKLGLSEEEAIRNLEEEYSFEEEEAKRYIEEYYK